MTHYFIFANLSIWRKKVNVGCMSIRPVSFVVALHKAVDLLFKVLETEVGKDSFNIEIF